MLFKINCNLVTFIIFKPLKKTSIYEKDTSLTEFHFDRSIVMSTYLVAFIIGEFDYVEQVNESGTLIRVYTPVGKSQMGDFTLDVILDSKSST